MLWDLIRDFFVEYIFGGWTSNGIQCDGFITYEGGFSGNTFGTSDTIFKLNNFYFFDDLETPLYITFGDWLSTTATIIALTIIVVLCCLFVYKIIKLIGGLIR